MNNDECDDCGASYRQPKIVDRIKHKKELDKATNTGFQAGRASVPRESKNVAVDFDGVIHRYRFGYKKVDEPMTDAKESLEKILSQGWEVIIHTARDENFVKIWCINNKFDCLLGPDGEWKKGVTYAEKPKAKFYIDDRALRFISWKDVEKYLL